MPIPFAMHGSMPCTQSDILTPPIVVEDRQLAVLVVHVATTMRRLTNVQWRGQATVAKAEAARGQTTINQKVAAKMFKIRKTVRKPS
jgi:hypothetical protein